MRRTKAWRPAKCFQTLKYSFDPYITRLKKEDYENDVGCGVYVPLEPQKTSTQ
jgi:hypothetical protein